VVADLPELPGGGCRGGPDRASLPHAVLVLRTRLRVGVLATAGRNRLPDVCDADDLGALAPFDRLPKVQTAGEGSSGRGKPF